MDVIVAGNSVAIAGRTMRCAVGTSGITQHKSEGDGATPAGCFPFREVLYRADRVQKPSCRLPVREIKPTDGWCDDPADPKYNQLVSSSYQASHENLWRDDALYDLIVVIGYNDSPTVPGAGSAIFMHAAHDNYQPTQGCIALELNDLQFVVEHLVENSHIDITGS